MQRAGKNAFPILIVTFPTVESRYFGIDELPTLAEEKNNEEQVRMCFDAYQSRDWKTLFD